MTAIHLLLFVLTSCCRTLCDVITAEDGTKSDFMNVLKQGLRRNNDDYIETTGGTINITNPYLMTTNKPTNIESKTRSKNSRPVQNQLGTGKFYYRRVQSTTNDLLTKSEKVNGSQRRQMNPFEANDKDSFSKEITESKSHIAANPVPVMKTTARTTLRTEKVLTKLMKVPFSTAPVGQMKFRSYTTQGLEKMNNEQLDKFRMFISKNKELFNEFMNKKRIEATQRATPQPAAVARGRQIDEIRLSLLGDVGGDAAAHPPMEFRAEPHVPLSPDQLDMAPARGAKIHVMRVKGRLCQRSVLVPEGPKYNRKGEVYLGAFGHKDGRSYRTPRPAVVLPRCCNCCRKSVLGCE